MPKIGSDNDENERIMRRSQSGDIFQRLRWLKIFWLDQGHWFMISANGALFMYSLCNLFPKHR